MPTIAKATENKNDESDNKIKYNPNIKAMTECDARSSIDGFEADSDKVAAAGISRKSSKTKQDKVQTLTDENLLSFNMVEEKDGEESSDDEGDEILKAMALDEDIKSIKELVKRDKDKEAETRSNAESEKSEIEKMIEEDLTTTFHETASLISSLSEQLTKQFAQFNQMQHRLLNNQFGGNPQPLPRMAQSQSLPVTADNVAFGSLFAGQQGTVFGAKNDVGAIVSSPLPPLSQNQASDPYAGAAAHTPTLPTIQQQKSDPIKKITTRDALNGNLSTPDNFSENDRNKKKKKPKLQLICTCNLINLVYF